MNVKAYMRAALAAAAVFLLIFAFTSILHGRIDPSVRDVVMVLVGAIITNFKDVHGFYFGTSQSSEAKNDVIEAMHGRPVTVDQPPDKPIPVEEVSS